MRRRSQYKGSDISLTKRLNISTKTNLFFPAFMSKEYMSQTTFQCSNLAENLGETTAKYMDAQHKLD